MGTKWAWYYPSHTHISVWVYWMIDLYCLDAGISSAMEITVHLHREDARLDDGLRDTIHARTHMALARFAFTSLPVQIVSLPYYISSIPRPAKEWDILLMAGFF